MDIDLKIKELTERLETLRNKLEATKVEIKTMRSKLRGYYTLLNAANKLEGNDDAK